MILRAKERYVSTLEKIANAIGATRERCTQSWCINDLCRFPVDWEKVTLNTWLTHLRLPMAAGQANCSYLPDVSFVRYLILTDCQPT